MDNNFSNENVSPVNDTQDMRRNWLDGIKRRFSQIGFAYFIFFIVYYGIQMLTSSMAGILVQYGLIPKENPEFMNVIVYGMTFIPTYLVSFPVLNFMLRNTTPTRPAPAHMTGGGIISTVLIVFFLMFAGNFIGRILMSVISATAGTEIVNSVDEMVNGNSMLAVFIFAVVLAPIFEETCFRRILLDRTAAYGERNAMILSGLAFGLFHANLYQFFYAFFIGLVFAYVYIRTGKIRYSIGLHMTVNFFGSIVPMLLMKDLDISALESGKVEDIMKLMYDPAFQRYMVYACFLVAVIIAGVITFIVIMSNHSISLDAKGAPMTKEEAKNVTYKNKGMRAFIILCIVVTILLIVAQTLPAAA